VQLDDSALVIVSGAPASGKTTLAQRLAGDLHLPLIAKDALKETLADAVGAPADVEASTRLGVAAYRVLYLSAGELLRAGNGVIIESNFRRGLSEAELRPLLALGRACLVHCHARAGVIMARYAERFARGERHPAHLDAARHDALLDDLAGARFDPLDLLIPALVVDTTDGLSPGYDEVRSFVATSIALPAPAAAKVAR
jgi:predicted kinase